MNYRLEKKLFFAVHIYVKEILFIIETNILLTLIYFLRKDKSPNKQ